MCKLNKLFSPSQKYKFISDFPKWNIHRNNTIMSLHMHCKFRLFNSKQFADSYFYCKHYSVSVFNWLSRLWFWFNLPYGSKFIWGLCGKDIRMPMVADYIVCVYNFMTHVENSIKIPNTDGGITTKSSIHILNSDRFNMYLPFSFYIRDDVHKIFAILTRSQDFVRSAGSMLLGTVFSFIRFLIITGRISCITNLNNFWGIIHCEPVKQC